MGRPRKPSMSEGKRNIIAQLLDEYDIQSAHDIEAALRDLLGGTIQNMLESELETQMEQSKQQDPRVYGFLGTGISLRRLRGKRFNKQMSGLNLLVNQK
jgi:hypothetical protein